MAKTSEFDLRDFPLERNYIINGYMDFWQRVAGNTTTINDAAGGNTYTADRFLCGRAGPTTKNFSILRSADVPTVAQIGGVVPYSYQVNCLTAIPSLNVADTCSIMQTRLEGYDYSELHQKTITVGFWVKLTYSGAFPVTNFPVSFQTSTMSYVAHVTINANNTWQFVKVTLDMGSNGTVFDQNMALRLTIGSSNGTNFQAGSLNAWVAGDRFSHASSFNFMGANTNVVRIAGLCLVEGASLAGDVIMRAGGSRNRELALCQRYYEKSYNSDVAPVAGFSNNGFTIVQASQSGINALSTTVYFKVHKRVAGTLTTWNNASGGSGANFYHISGNADYSNATVFQNGASCFTLQMTSTGNQSEKFFHWACDAEL